MSTRLRFCCSSVLFALLALLVVPNASGQQAPLGSWAGELSVGGTQLRIVFHIEDGEDGLTATMDSPDQGATGIPVSEVTVAADSVTLTVGGIGGEYSGVRTEGGQKIEGTWTQGGQSFPLTLTPADASDTAPPSRPQHPEPPYPYAERDVTFQNEAAGITLAGTLTRPKAEGPHPAVVLISGSGPQDRNSEIFNHKLFLVLADHLTRHGIAVLRYDERGVGKSGGQQAGATSKDLASDVAAAARFLKNRTGVDEGSVGLIGLSEGGILAPMVHVEHEPVSFMVLLAGPSVPGADVIVGQSAAIAAAQGASPAATDSIRNAQRRVAEAVRTKSDSAETARALEPILAERGANQKQIQAQIEQLTGAWFRYFVRHDPAPILRQIDVPVLALYGSNDLQVLPDQNVEPMQEALRAAPTDDATVRVLDGLNHLFQPADTGLPSEYAQIETTMAPRALDVVTEWIRARTSAR